MTSTSTQLIAGVLRQPSSEDNLHWVLPEALFRTAQDYAAAEYVYRLRLCSVQLHSSQLLRALPTDDLCECGSSPSLPPPVNANSRMLLYPVQVTAQLIYMEEPLSPVVESSAVYATAHTASPIPGAPPHAAQTVEFAFAEEEWIIFPLELCDVPLDATCELHLWYNDTHVGTTAFYVYSVEGELQVGQHHLSLTTASSTACFANDHLADETAALLAEYHRGRLPVIPWLDALSVHQLEARQAMRASGDMHGPNQNKARDFTVEGEEGEVVALLTLYLPTATTAVFFEPAVASVAAEMKPLLTCADAASTKAGLAEPSPDDAGDYSRRLFPDQYTFFKDYNLSEAKAAITSKSPYFVSESSAPPGPKERHHLASLLRRPPIQLDHGAGGVGGIGVTAGVGGVVNRLEETRLLWKYRHFICKDGRFLLPFLRSVDWVSAHTTARRAATALMHQWARPGFADTLACLSFYFDHVAPVRQYAVHLLRQESDARLCHVAFQLLQAVRYDSAEGELASLLLDRAVGCWEMCSTLYTMLTVEVALERRRSKGADGGDAAARSPPPPSPSPSPSRSSAAEAVFEPLLRRLADRLTQHSPLFISRLRQQHAMHRVLQQLSRQLQKSALDRLGKTALGNKLIAKQSCGLYNLFDTLRHRAPHTSNASFAADTASARQERSPTSSISRAECEGENEEGDNDRGEREGGGGGGELGSVSVQEEAEAEAVNSNGNRHTRSSTTRVAASPSLPPLPPPSPSRHVSAPTVDVLDHCGVVTLPTHPAIPITGIVPNSLYIFKSAKLPIRITFKAVRPPRAEGMLAATAATTTTTALAPFGSAPGVATKAPASPSSTSCFLPPLAMQQQQRSSASLLRSTTASAPAAAASPALPCAAPTFVEDPVGSVEENTVPLTMMYKYDDDVRQDQLIVQLIRVMDGLLQQDGLQLYLTPYRVVATGPCEGLVEIVPQVTTFFSVQREVLKYLRVYNPTAELLRQAMDRYTRSFAGYCVITFVLGIGDRHLENILLAHDGRLLHIDFGYVLGNDPKPFPPPMKINREMVEVLGGPESTGFTEFKLYCCSAYNILRTHAALLLHMLLLGVHAENMPQITGGGGTADPRVNLLKVQEKLRLDLTNAQATQYLQNVIADSVGSIFTNLWDVLHAAAQATRS